MNICFYEGIWKNLELIWSLSLLLFSRPHGKEKSQKRNVRVEVYQSITKIFFPVSLCIHDSFETDK